MIDSINTGKVSDAFQPFLLKLLDFDKLLNLIAGNCVGEPSARDLQGIKPFASIEDIKTRQSLMKEITRMLREGNPLKMASFHDIVPLLHKARPEGAILDAVELYHFIPVLSIAISLSDQIEMTHEAPMLQELVLGLTGFPDLLRRLRKSVDSEGNLLDTASAVLSDLREQIRKLDNRISKKLEEMVRDEKIAVFLQDDFITKRSGRWVIPVRMDSKGQISGIVHDVSHSGETAFMEPIGIISLANELENLNAEAKAEEIRILRNLSSLIRDSVEGIYTEFRTIVYIDVLNALSVFSDSLDMEIPLINQSGFIKIERGRHPLLAISFRKDEDQRQVVPLDATLGRDNNVMVITGSNAGGKTVAIKTIGLLLLMALSGMPVPADSSSDFPLVQELLVDIGDEQSIDNNLSTFSAHVSNISKILRQAGKSSIVLLDELGTGTDPDEGAALACAVLKELQNSGPLVFATTHLADIKGFVHRTPAMLNASMEFDGATLLPLYRLRVGEPGQSHALETARRYGLPDTVIDSAKALLGGVKVEFDNLVADLNRKRSDYEKAVIEIEKQKSAIDNEKRIIDVRLAKAETETKERLSKAYTEASDIVLSIKRQMNSLLEEVKKAAAAGNRASVLTLLRKADNVQKEIKEKIVANEVDIAPAPSIDEIQEGDLLFVKSLGYDVPVIMVNRKDSRVKVRAGSIELDLPLSDLRAGKGKTYTATVSSVKVESTDETVSSRINLIGLRIDEALSRLEPFLNHASLAGLNEVTIIHGFGTGALSRAVREHLDGHPLIRKFRKGEKEEGGAGVTVAALM